MGELNIARGATAWALLSALSCLWLHTASAAAGPSERPDVQHRVVAYLASWSVPQVSHPEKLTHINFAFAHIDKTGHVLFENPGIGACLRNLQTLKQQNPALKLIVSVGGWQ